MGILSFLLGDKDSDRVIPKPEFPPTQADAETARARLYRNIGSSGPQVDAEVQFDLSIIQEWERLQKEQEAD